MSMEPDLPLPPICDWLIITLALAVILGVSYRVYGASTRTEMERYRTATPDRCEACGAPPKLLRSLEIHHIKPQHAFPELANDPTNLIKLCSRCHIFLGHAGDGACRKYVENLREVLALRVIKDNK